GTNDNKVAQIQKNPKIEFCLMVKKGDGQGYVRGTGLAKIIKDKKQKEKIAKHCDFFSEFWKSPDDGIKDTPKDWPYERLVICWGKHSCHMGVVKALKALAEIPFNQRNKQVRNTIEEGVEYLLKHHIYKRSHDLNRVSKPGWLRLGFPLMYQTDILEILGILTRLGYHDERMQEAIDLLISKQDNQGKWKLESTFNGRFQTNIEQKGKPSKWITLNALKVLKNFYS
ncbi:unnamed protein product, partial [marine sediment metagenome]